MRPAFGNAVTSPGMALGDGAGQGPAVPTLPFVDPIQPGWLAWLVQVRRLEPAHWARRHGRG